MNTELLLKVKEQILQEPERFDMRNWVWGDGCNTTGCIAGWAVAIGEDRPLSMDLQFVKGLGCVVDRAQRLLDLSDPAKMRLFHSEAWPHHVAAAYNNADQRVRAKIAAKRIDLFIASNGEV